MSNLRHNLYGALILIFLVSCVAGLLALGVVALNAFSDYRHEQYIYGLEHPTPVPTPGAGYDMSTGNGVLSAGVEAMNNCFPVGIVVFGIALIVQCAAYFSKALRDM